MPSLYTPNILTLSPFAIGVLIVSLPNTQNICPLAVTVIIGPSDRIRVLSNKEVPTISDTKTANIATATHGIPGLYGEVFAIRELCKSTVRQVQATHNRKGRDGGRCIHCTATS